MKRPEERLIEFLAQFDLRQISIAESYERNENLLVAGYDPGIGAHYWTDEQGGHLVFDNEIPQPE